MSESATAMSSPIRYTSLIPVLLSAGTSIGLGALIGALCGATFGCWRGTLLKIEYDTRDKTIAVTITPDGLRKLLFRSLQLLSAVRQRGLADVDTAFVVGSDAKPGARLEIAQSVGGTVQLARHRERVGVAAVGPSPKIRPAQSRLEGVKLKSVTGDRGAG